MGSTQFVVVLGGMGCGVWRGALPPELGTVSWVIKPGPIWAIYGIVIMDDTTGAALDDLQDCHNPVHFAINNGKVAIYQGNKVLGLIEKQDAPRLALAMMIGPQQIGGVLISDERLRYGIARAALELTLRP
jgi:hypothetical protein